MNIKNNYEPFINPLNNILIASLEKDDKSQCSLRVVASGHLDHLFLCALGLHQGNQTLAKPYVA